jgi:two-component system cell cycle response regulator
MKEPDDATIRVLLVEDNPGDARLMKELITEVSTIRFDLTHVVCLSEAQGRLSEEPFDVILLDLSLPDSHGLETLLNIQRQGDKAPVVVLTGLDDERIAIEGVQKGAQDYLVKGRVDNNLLVRAIRYAIERHRVVAELRRANQRILEQEKSVIQEERLKVLLEMAGATAHELNQPLTSLLGYIELMRKDQDNPEKLARRMALIEEAGLRIAEVVRKIQNIRHYQTEAYVGSTRMIKIDQETDILFVEDSHTTI